LTLPVGRYDRFPEAGMPCSLSGCRASIFCLGKLSLAFSPWPGRRQMTVKDGEIAAELGFSSFVWVTYLFVLDESGL
jgi:hypothetical protein